MSTLLTTLVLPLALSGALPSAADPVAAPVTTAHLVKFVTPAKSPVTPRVTAPVLAPQPQSSVELIKIQAPQTAPKAPAPSPTPQVVPAAERSAIVDRVGKALSDVKTAQGNFTQVNGQGKVSNGVFYINRPGRVRFEYTTPEPMFIVSDGVTVSVNEPKRKSCDSGPVSASTLHLFLRANVDLKRDGSVTDVTTSNGSHFVTLIDKSGEAQGKMILEFRSSDFEMLGWRIVDGSGAETRVKLMDTKKNVSVKPALFVVKDCADDDRR